MRRIILLLLFLASIVLGQAKYFCPVTIESSSGRPIKNATVELYNAGTLTKVATLTWQNAGRYYYTGGESTVPSGVYDVYVDNVLHLSNIYFGNNDAAALQAQWRADIGSNLYQPDSLGIGTTAPFARIHARYSSDEEPRGIVSEDIFEGTSGPLIHLMKSRGTVENPTAILNGDALGNITFIGRDDNGYSQHHTAWMSVKATEDYVYNTNYGCEMFFKVTPKASGYAPFLHTTLEDDGDLVVENGDLYAKNLHVNETDIYGKTDTGLRINSDKSVILNYDDACCPNICISAPSFDLLSQKEIVNVF